MDVSEYIHTMAMKARAAAGELAKLSTGEKNAALEAIAAALERHAEEIKSANAADVANARQAGLAAAMVDRLTLTDARFAAMVEGVRHVATLPDPVGEELWTRERPSGITIRKVRVPFGVIAVVFESRPNVFVDTAALCLKTGNAVILRGGKEAIRTNGALARAVREGLGGLGGLEGLVDSVLFVEVQDHAAVTELVRAVGLVDVAIPRGGERLIRAMCEAALVPVLKHYKGVCHIYVDDEADLGMALSILDNAKTQRPGVCNAAECLLINRRLAPLFLPMVEAWAKDKGVLLHKAGEGTGNRERGTGKREEGRGNREQGTGNGERGTGKREEGTGNGERGTGNRERGTEIDWEREFLSLEMNVGIVDDWREAIRHINRYSSHHSECIVTNNAERAKEFLRDVDSACVYHNVSTRFTDGGEFGMGAEIGISTDKLHARGPMGLEELTTYKYVVTGDGVVRK